MIEKIPKSNGVPRAKGSCDDCGKEEIFACDYRRKGPADWEVNEGQALRKLTGLGWTYVKGRLRCASCEAKRKVVSMSDVKKTKEEAAPKEPTKAQKRSIMQMLESAYDTDGERYMQGETDFTVATVLSVPPAWVADIREQFFGPDGGNEDIEALAKDLDKVRSDLVKQIQERTKETDQMVAALEKVKGFATDLDRIKGAVGPHKLKAAGVR